MGRGSRRNASRAPQVCFFFSFHFIIIILLIFFIAGTSMCFNGHHLAFNRGLYPAPQIPVEWNLAEGPAILEFRGQNIPVEWSHSGIDTGMVFVGCAENASDPAQFGKAKHHAEIALSWLRMMTNLECVG